MMLIRYLYIALSVTHLAQAQTPIYRATNLGSLPGKDSSYATGINDSGVVSGNSADAPWQPLFRGFIYQNGVFTNLGLLQPDGNEAQTYAINNSGVIVGYAKRGDINTPERASIKVPGFPLRELLGLSFGRGEAIGISNDGRAVGWNTNADLVLRPEYRQGESYYANMRATLWMPTGADSHTAAIDLNISGGLGANDSAIATGVNSAGQIVGSYMTSGGFRGFLRQPSGTVITLQPIEGAIETGARAISESGGYVTGTIIFPVPFVRFPSEGGEVFSYTESGGMTRLGKCPGSYLTMPQAVNNSGKVVGICRYEYGDRAAVLHNNTMTELYNLVDETRGPWVFLQARGINSQGEIVGWGLYNGSVRPFLLTPINPQVTTTVRLLSSTGAGLSGGVASYLDGNNVWQTIGTTGADGSVQGTVPAGSLRARMTYGGRIQEKIQDAATTFVFNTTSVQLQFSDTIEYQDAAGAFRTFTKPATEMLPGDTYFKFGSAGTALLSIGSTTIRKSIAAEKLLSSTGTPLNGATGRYYAGSWQPCSVTGVPAFGHVLCVLDNFVTSATFSLDFAFTSSQKTQNIALDSYVVFQTTRVRLQLKNSLGSPLDPGVARYYGGAWRDAGSTSGGEVAIELLPGTYAFTMNYASTQQQKSQNVGVDPVVVFQTVNATLELRDSANALIDTGTATYYGDLWLGFGVTSGGRTQKELLPGTYSFRMTYNSTQQQLSQNIGVNPVVTFRTRAVTAQLKDSNGNPLDTGTVLYYAGAWLSFGTTSGGSATRELLPGTYQFRMTYASTSSQISQNIDANPTVVFQTRAVVVRLIDSQGGALDTGTATYYGGSWLSFGSTSGGQVTKQLLPGTYAFTMSYAFGAQQKSQDIGADPVVTFQTGKVRSATNTCVSYYAGAWRTFTNDLELLPASYPFRFSDGTGDTATAVAPGVINVIH